MKVGMEYSIAGLQAEYNKRKKLHFLYFWEHDSAPDGRMTESCLSQWWPAPFQVDGIRYSSAEQYMMAEKARLFSDAAALAAILQTHSPKHIKQLGREVRGFISAEWDACRVAAVEKGNFAKFTQNPALLEYLRGTKTKVLVEASPYDRIWGIGLGREHLDIKNPLKWKGLNLLGFALMRVRDVVK